MSHRFLLLLYTFACILLTGCSEKYDEGLGLIPTLTPRYLAATPTAMTFTATSSEQQSLNITSTQTPWIIDNEIDWINLTTTSGTNSSSVGVGALENQSGDDARLGVFFLKSNVNDWTYETPISVTQSGATPIISLSKSEFDLTGAEHSEDIIVSSNCSWDVYSSEEWLTTQNNGANITFTVTCNISNEYRSATISVIHTGTTNTSAQITIRQAPATITASTESLTFDNTPGTLDISIKSEAPWSASTSNSWIELTPLSADAGSSILKVSVSPNTSINERTGYIILTIGSKERVQIPIRQRGIYVEVDKTSLDFSAFGESQTISISSNTNWTILDCPSWLSVSQKNGNGAAIVTITATNNSSTNNRFANISVTQEGVTIGSAIAISQNGKKFEISSQSLSFEDTQSTKGIELIAEDSWTIRKESEWISVSPESGSGNNFINISVSENETEDTRIGDIHFTMLDKTMSVNVSQKGKVFSADTDNTNISFPAEGGNNTINITSNTSWSLFGFPDWTKLSKTSGKGNSSVVITAEDNPNTTERSATMYLQIEGKTDKKSISLRQYGKTFSLSPTTLNFNDKSSTQTVNIETDGEWRASTVNSWMNISPSSAVGSSSLLVTVTENTSNLERNGAISVSMGDKAITITVNQKGKYLTIENNLLSYTSKGGTIGINITTNDTWSAYIENDANWITLSQTNGNGTTDLKVYASDNASVNKRTEYIVVETPHGQSIRIKVTQEARYLTIDHNSVLFYYKGGTSETITISTDGTYTISCSDSWLSVNQSANTFTVTATENNLNEPRFGSITIALTDLTEGSYSISLSVTQLNNGGTFLIYGYNEDKNYDTTDDESTSVNLSIFPFGNDTNWDSSNNGNIDLNGTSVSIKGHSEDQNWDITTTDDSNCSIEKLTYQEDSNWDSNNTENEHNNGNSISISNYTTDKNWDTVTTVSNKLTITRTGFKDDVDYDSHNTKSSSGTIIKTTFNEENNWQ